MIEKYNLYEENIAFLPTPHDCKITKVELSKDFLVFTFKDDISKCDSIKSLKPNAKSLIIKYHLIDDLKTYRYRARRFFLRESYVLISNNELERYAEKRLEYLYTYRGYNSLILYLWHKSTIMLDISCDYIEYEWIE